MPEYSARSESVFAELKAILPKIREQGTKVYLNISLVADCNEQSLRTSFVDKLCRLGLNTVDYCTFGPVSRTLLDRLKKIDFQTFLAELLKDELVGAVGIRISDRSELIAEVASAFPSISYVRINYSPADFMDRPGKYGYQVAATHNLGVVATGHIFDSDRPYFMPDFVKQEWDKTNNNGSIDAYMLSMLIRSEKNQAVVVEPNNLRTLESYSKIISESQGAKLRVAEQICTNNLRDAYKRSMSINCPACGCCMPCPYGVDIPGIMVLYNEMELLENYEFSRFIYKLLGYEQFPCQKCNLCVKQCPKENKIPDIAAYLYNISSM